MKRNRNWTRTSIDKDVLQEVRKYCVEKRMKMGDFQTQAAIEKLSRELAKGKKST